MYFLKITSSLPGLISKTLILNVKDRTRCNSSIKIISDHLCEDTTIWFDAKHDYKPSPSHSKCLGYLQTANCALIFQREWIGWCHNQSQSIVPMWDSVAWHHSNISQWSECCISGIFVLYLDRAQWRGFQCVCKQHSCEQKAFNYMSSTHDRWART